MTIDVDQFKPYLANWIIIGIALTAIHCQMGYDDVVPDKGGTPVIDKSVIRKIFIKLIQYKYPCRLALINPQPLNFNLICIGYFNSLDGKKRSQGIELSPDILTDI